MHQQPNKKRRRIVSTLAVLAIVLLIIVAVSLSTKKKMTVHTVANNMPANTNTASNATATTTTPTTNTHTSGYRDGSYTATGSYDSPGGVEQLTVEVTLQNSIITATSAQSGASDPESAMFQSQFIGGYKQLVIGKNIADVSVSRVSGSSLTSQGFNDALEQIKKQAQQNT